MSDAGGDNTTTEMALIRDYLDKLIAESKADFEQFEQGRLTTDQAWGRSIGRQMGLQNVAFWIAGKRPGMKVSEMFPSRYIKAADLGGRSYTFKIRPIKLEEMRDPQSGQVTKKPVMYFDGPRKGLILNRTIAETLVDLTTHDEMNLWPGYEVTIYPTSVVAFGKTFEVVRVRAADVHRGTTAPADQLFVDLDELDETGS